MQTQTIIQTNTIAYRRFTALLVLTAATLAHAQTSVLTVNNDNGRTGANMSESALNTSNVNVGQFGKIFSRAVDAWVYGQPLYVPNLNFPGSGVHNVVFVATMNNTVYAFDADDASASAPLWQTSLGPSVPATPVYFPSDQTSGLAPTSGIVSTPVIDPASGTIYAVALVLVSGNPTYELHALDIITGLPKPGSPTIIQATSIGFGPDSVGGVITFNARTQIQRTGLLLLNGRIYFAFGSYGDLGAYHGWVMGYDGATLQQTAVLNLTPGGMGGIWQAGGGLSADSAGFIYVCTGNGTWDGILNFGESCIKLDPTQGLSVIDYFTPYYYNSLNAADEDLGSGRPLLIPRTNLMVAGGKQSLLYVLNRSDLGQASFSDLGVVQQVATTGRIFSPMAYWDNPALPYLYVWGSSNTLKAYAFNGAQFNPNPTSASTMTSSYGGGLTVSSNGSTAGSGIVWATSVPASPSFTLQPATLRAFDATNLATELWDSGQNAARDAVGNVAKFSQPIVANGKVYASTFSSQLVVYGLLSNATLTVSPSTISLGAVQFQRFTANAPVNWTIVPAGVGSISANGVYTAPATVASQQTVTVTATLISDNSKTASATVTLLPVSITANPASASLFASQSQQFTVTGQGNTAVTWSVPSNSGSISPTGLYTAPSSIPVIQNVTVTATSIVDNSKTATANVTLNPPAPPQIAQQPQDATVFSGQTASFSVTATSVGLSYQWQSMPPGGTFTDIANAVLSTYATPVVSLADSGTQFRCVVSNAQGTATSNAATLVVLASGASFVTSEVVGRPRNDYTGWVGMSVQVGASPLVVSSLGRIAAVGNSRTHVLKIVNAATGVDVPGGSTTVNMATGSGGAPFLYGALASPVTLNANTTYYVLSQEQQSGDQWFDNNTTVQTTNVGTVNSAVYGITAPYTPIGGAGNSYVPIDFKYATVVVTPPAVSLYPSQSQQFTAVVSGGGGGVAWTLTPNVGTISASGLYTAPSSIKAIQAITATATSLIDSTKSGSAVITLSTLVAPTITQQPLSVSTSVGNTATFSVTATGPSLTYQWQSMPSGAASFANLAVNATLSSYTTPATTFADSGTQFRCVVTNSLGPATSTAATLTVLPVSSNFVTAMTLGTIRNDYTGWVGMKITVGASPLMVTALGRIFVAGSSGTHLLKIVNATVGVDQPSGTSYWVNHTGVDVPGGQVSLYAAGGTPGGFLYAPLASPILLQPNTDYFILSQEQAGGDRWYDHDFSAVQTTNAAVLAAAVFASGSPYAVKNASAGHSYGPVDFSYFIPGLTVSPSSVTLSASGTQQFTATATGGGSATVTWSLTPNAASAGSITQAGLYTAPASIPASQTVTVTATATDSSVATSTITLTPPSLPNITQQPQSVTLVAGQIATFGVTATGAGLTYQWQSMPPGGSIFSNIAGASSSIYSTPPALLSDSGTQFRCVVSNAQGPVTSNAATLTVIASGTSFLTSQTFGRLRNDYTGWVGINLTVGAQPMVVSAVGRMALAGNSQTHTVKIVTASTAADVSGGSVPVNTVGGSPGSFAYGPLTVPVTLQANTTYYILSQEQQAGDQWYDYDTVVQTTSAATVNGAVYGVLPPYTLNGSAGHSYGPLNLLYTINSSSPPSITKQPQSTTVFAGQTASFSVTATGTGLNYQWQWMPSGGGSFANIAGATSSSYTTPITSLADNGTQFRCMVSNLQGPVTSNAATLSVLTAGTSFLTGQTLGRLRNDYTGWVGVNLTVGAQPIVLSALGRMVVAGNSQTHTVKIVTAATGADLAGGSTPVNAAAGAAGGFVYGGLVNPVTLQPNTAYYVLSQEQQNGDQWYDLDTVVQTTNVGTVNNVVYGLAAPYTLTGSPGHAYVPINFIYTVAPAGLPSITQQPQNVTLFVGQTASFSVTAAGSGLTYQWQSKPSGGSFGNIAGATSTTYTAPPALLADNGAQFRCVVSNAQGPTTSNAATITVFASGSNFIVSQTLGHLRNNYTGWVGMSVTVGTRPIALGALGRMVVAGNTQTHAMKIVNAATGVDLAGASTVVNTAGGTAGSFAYGTLPSPVTLQANTTYYVLTQEQQTGDQWYDYDTTVPTTTDAAAVGAIYSSGNTYVVSPASVGRSYGPVNFTYVVSGP